MRGYFDEDELDDDGYPFDEEDNDFEDDEFDCGMDGDGGCRLAGTEECDWMCPYSYVRDEDE